MLIRLLISSLGIISIFCGIVGFIRYSIQEKYHMNSTYLDEILSYMMIICGLLFGIIAYGYAD